MDSLLFSVTRALHDNEAETQVHLGQMCELSSRVEYHMRVGKQGVGAHTEAVRNTH